MELYKVTLKAAPTITSRPIRVEGRSKVVFFRARSSVSDVFFEADTVVSINVARNDLDAVLGQKTGGGY